MDFDRGYYQYRRWYSEATPLSFNSLSHGNSHLNERSLATVEDLQGRHGECTLVGVGRQMVKVEPRQNARRQHQDAELTQVIRSLMAQAQNSIRFPTFPALPAHRVAGYSGLSHAHHLLNHKRYL